MNDNNKFCCINMRHYLINKEEGLIHYDSSLRSYNLPLIDGMYQAIWFCPWCSEKLPKDLNQEWEYILEKEYGIKEPGFNQDKISPEFKTDEWSKKRGL